MRTTSTSEEPTTYRDAAVKRCPGLLQIPKPCPWGCPTCARAREHMLATMCNAPLEQDQELCVSCLAQGRRGNTDTTSHILQRQMVLWRVMFIVAVVCFLTSLFLSVYTRVAY